MVAAVAVFVVDLVHYLANQKHAEPTGLPLFKGDSQVGRRKRERIEGPALSLTSTSMPPGKPWRILYWTLMS